MNRLMPRLIPRLMTAALIGIVPLASTDTAMAAVNDDALRGPGAEKESNSFPGYNFQRAIREGDLDAAKRIANQGIPIDIPDHTGKTPIFYSIERGYTDISLWLLDNDININQKNTSHETLLIATVLAGNHDVATAIIKKGGKINARNRRGESALMRAVLVGDIAMAKLLLDGGADPKLADFTGRTPTDLGQSHRNPRMRGLFRSR